MHGCVGDLALFMFLLLFFVYRSRAWISRREISVLSVLLKESLMGCVGSEIKLERGRVASLEMMAIFSARSQKKRQKNPDIGLNDGMRRY